MYYYYIRETVFCYCLDHELSYEHYQTIVDFKLTLHAFLFYGFSWVFILEFLDSISVSRNCLVT